MKKINILIIALIFTTSYCQNTVEIDSIRWKEGVKLEWKDFKGGVPFGDSGIKKAASALGITASVKNSLEDSIPIFKVEVFFYRSQSWTILKTDDLLAHEQGHFDLTEIYARKLRKIYLELNNKKETDLNKYSKAYNEINDELDFAQDTYDKEVYFIDENKNKWFLKIAEELNNLKFYSLKCDY